jgi:hypothetical protein
VRELDGDATRMPSLSEGRSGVDEEMAQERSEPYRETPIARIGGRFAVLSRLRQMLSITDRQPVHSDGDVAGLALKVPLGEAETG